MWRRQVVVCAGSWDEEGEGGEEDWLAMAVLFVCCMCSCAVHVCLVLFCPALDLAVHGRRRWHLGRFNCR